MAVSTPTDYLTAQQRYRSLVMEKGSFGEISGKKEVKRAGIIDTSIAALMSAFPGLSLEKDYTALGEVSDTERPATLAEIQALANSIPIPSLGAQGSTPPPMESTDSFYKGGFGGGSLFGIPLLYILGGLVAVVAGFFILRK